MKSKLHSGVLVILIIAALYLLLISCGQKPVEGIRTAKEQVTPAQSPQQPEAQATTGNTEQEQKNDTPTHTQNTQMSSLDAGESKKTPAVFTNPEKAKEAEVVYNQGFEMFMSGKNDEALGLFDKALGLDPMSYTSYNGKGIILCYKGNYKDGMDLIKKSLELKPDYAYSYFNMALAYKLRKDYDNALVWFDKAISFNPDDAWSYYGISTIYADRDNIEKSIVFLKKAVELDSSVKDAARSQSHYDRMRGNPEFLKLVK